MIACKQCGNAVRLGAWRITVNRKRGVSHYIEHVGHFMPCASTKGFSCSMMKPYPPDGQRPVDEMMRRWETENAP